MPNTPHHLTLEEIAESRYENVATSDALADWLHSGRDAYAPVLATRIALRVLPIALREDVVLNSPNYALNLFRCAYFCWASQNLPSQDISKALGQVKFVIDQSSSAIDKPAIFSLHHALIIAWSASSNDLSQSIRPQIYDRAVHSSIIASLATAEENVGPVSQRAYDNFWDAIVADCNWLDRQSDHEKAARQLTRRKLWPIHAPSFGVAQAWKHASESLIKADRDFQVWLDWYENRLVGQRSSFRIPFDRYRKEDKQILRYLAQSSDDGLWSRGANFVNSTLASWIEEATERAARQQQEKDKLLRFMEQQLLGHLDPEKKTEIPFQNANALRFSRFPDGKIGLSSVVNFDELRSDQDARDRHLLAVEDAKQLLAACAVRNSAERLTAILTAYIAAAGENIEAMRPSLFVQKGERLRQELARYEGDDTDLPPLPDSILLDLNSVCKAHNMVVGLDPALLARDTAQLPPDAQTGDVTPLEVREVVHEADEAGVLQNDVAEIMDEAVDLVPAGADATDRRFRWCVESCRNLVIEAFAIALNKPVVTTAVVAGTYALGPLPFIGNALACGVFLISRRKWIEERLGRHAPTWKALFADLCERLEKHTPLSESTKN